MTDSPSDDTREPAGSERGEVFSVDGVVVAVIPEYRQALVRTADGGHLSITRHTVGLNYADLREGQCVRCVVTKVLPRVLQARLLR